MKAQPIDSSLHTPAHDVVADGLSLVAYACDKFLLPVKNSSDSARGRLRMISVARTCPTYLSFFQQ